MNRRNLFPVLSDDDLLVGRHGLAHVPVRDLAVWAPRGRRRASRRPRGARRPTPRAASSRRVGSRHGRPEQVTSPTAHSPRSDVPSLPIHHHAAAHIVRGRDHWDRPSPHVDPVREAAGVDVREALRQILGVAPPTCRGARGRRRCASSRSRWPAPRRHAARGSFISWCRSMNAVPSVSRRMPPSPRRASLIRKLLASGW